MFLVTRIFTTVEVFTFLHNILVRSTRDDMFGIGDGVGWGGDDNILVRSTRDDMFGTTYMFGIGDGVGWGGDDNILVRSTRDDMFGTTYMFGIGDGVGVGMITYLYVAHVITYLYAAHMELVYSCFSHHLSVGSTWKSFAQNKWKAEPDRHSMVDSGTEFISGSFATHASDKYTSCGKKGKKTFRRPRTKTLVLLFPKSYWNSWTHF